MPLKLPPKTPVTHIAKPGKQGLRRGFRWLAVSALALLAALAVVLVSYLGWANSLPPPPADLAPVPSPNGYHAIITAVTELPPGNDFTPRQVKSASLPALQQALRSSEPVLERLHAALALECRIPLGRSLVGEHGARLRAVIRRMAASAHVALLAGDPDRACSRSLDLLRLGERLGKGGSLIDHLQAQYATEAGGTSLEPCITRLDAREAHVLGSALDARLAALPTFAEVLQDARAVYLRQAQEGLRSREWVCEVLHDLYGWVDHSPATTVERTRDQLLYAFYPKPLAYGDELRCYDELLAAARSGTIIVPPVPKDPLVKRGYDMIGGVFDLQGLDVAGARAKLQLLRLEVALREYSLRQNAYPADLGALAPGYVQAVPLDPFSNRPYVYRRVGSSYTLYSVGPDGTDEGGRPLPTPWPLHVSRAQGERGDLVAGHLFRKY